MARKVVVVAAMKKKRKGKKNRSEATPKIDTRAMRARVCVCVCIARYSWWRGGGLLVGTREERILDRRS